MSVNLPEFHDPKRDRLRLLFNADLWNPRRFGACLCEMEHQRVLPNRFELEPVRVVTEWHTEDILPGHPVPSTFSMHFDELQNLANELARVGIYPESQPKAAPVPNGQIEDLQHNRNFLEGVVTTLIKKG